MTDHERDLVAAQRDTDQPSVEEVLEWLEDIESAFAASVTDAKMPRVAAHIIREQREEIEEWANLYRRTRDTMMVRGNEMAELRDQVAYLTERLTITDEKVKAAFAEQGRHHIRYDPAMVCILTAAGMIDPEVKS